VRLVLISDTHNMLGRIKVPEGDVLIHAGDATGVGSARELSRFNMDLATLPHPTKLFVPGNHDKLFEQSFGIAKSLITQAIVLCDEQAFIDPDDFSVQVGGERPRKEALSIYMSPWQPAFSYGWAFNLKGEKHARKIWDRVPDDTDVLVTHGPPHGLLDGVRRPSSRGSEGVIEHTGCPILRDRVEAVKPRLHVCGHIHEGHGRDEVNDIIRVNASICTEHYEPINKPIVVDL
jgi:hypothetical protein